MATAAPAALPRLAPPILAGGHDAARSAAAVAPLVLLLTVFFFCARTRYTTRKQHAWLLTTVSSAVMTLTSLPFLLDYAVHGASVQHIRAAPALALAANRFFQAYLVTDLILGTIYYREQIGLLTGFVHHAVYIFIVETAIRRSWPHIFCLCAFMELPTCILAVATLRPRLRSNALFAGTFFATRIALHIALCIAYALPANRAAATAGSPLPAALLACAFPLHAMWFRGCVLGFVRRRAAARLAAAKAASVAAAAPSPTPSAIRSRLAPRRAPFVRALRLALAAARRLRRARLPARTVVYEYVGLGRPVEDADGARVAQAVY